MERVMTDCFWCGETYELAVQERCPNCSTDIDTKSIKIVDTRQLINGENETTS